MPRVKSPDGIGAVRKAAAVSGIIGQATIDQVTIVVVTMDMAESSREREARAEGRWKRTGIISSSAS